MSQHHTLRAAPETVHWGYYDAQVKPVLTIKSGDTITLDSVSGGLDVMPEPGSRFTVLPEHTAILQKVAPGAGPHILTGPIAIEGAEPGDTLRVDILEVKLRQDWGFNRTRVGFGALPDDFKTARRIHIPLDIARSIATMPWGLEMEAAPFFGCMGTAPPAEAGRLSSVEPRDYGGNIDLRDLVGGTCLFLPVFNRGGLFSAGDGHAAQGHGEVNLTAIETALTGILRFTVEKSKPLARPRVETPAHYITMAFDPDLDEAARIALRDMIGFIQSKAGLSADDAYTLCSVGADLTITQVVNRHKGVHVALPRRLID